MINAAAIECRSAEEALAVLVVRPDLARSMPVGAKLIGIVRGPYSEQSRTLPAEFELTNDGNGQLIATIVDPCYSTDMLKMVYELMLEVTFDGKKLTEHRTRIELRRTAPAKTWET